MSDPFFKRVEIGFRRLLIRLLGRIIRRSRPLPTTIDYNQCKFLFVRQDMIGDVLVSTPLFAALKHRYPQAAVDALLSTKNHFVVANDQNIRRRWVYEKNITSAFLILRGIRAERYDFVIDLMDNPSATSTVLCLLSGARWTVGIKKDNAFAYDIAVPLLSRRDTHIVDRIAQLLTPFGIRPTEVELKPRYCPTEESKEVVRRFLSSHEAESTRLLGINISAGSEVRFWGIENFRELIRRMRTRFPDLVPLVLYAPEHRERGAGIARGVERCLLSPPTQSFDEFAAFVQCVSYLITPDTSAVHLAAAFDVPAVVLYVQSNKELRIWDPYGVEHETLVADVDDLKAIRVEEVASAFSRLYERLETIRK